MYKGKNILITGVTGSGGSYLAEYIVENHKDGDAEFISYEEALRIKEKMPLKPRLNPY